jgi:hypothetical protein
VDRSAANGYEGDKFKKLLEKLRTTFPDVSDARISLANYNVAELTEKLTALNTLDASQVKMDSKLPIAGGFDLDRALTHAIADYTNHTLNQSTDLPPEPIFVVLGQTKLDALPELEKTRIWQSMLSQLQIYAIGSGDSEASTLAKASTSSALIRVGSVIRPAHPRRSLIFPESEQAPEYYDPAKQAWQPLTHDRHAPDSAWAQAIALWVNNHRYAASPGSAATNLKQLVERSRSNGIMIPATSYIVVENEAQWRILQKKEGQKLEQNEALDFLETPAPGALYIALGFGGWLLWRKRRVLAFK